MSNDQPGRQPGKRAPRGEKHRQPGAPQPGSGLRAAFDAIAQTPPHSDPCRACGQGDSERRPLVRHRGYLYHQDCLNRLLINRQIDEVEDLADMIADPHEVPDEFLTAFGNALQAADNALCERTGTPHHPAPDPTTAPHPAAPPGGPGVAGGFVFEQAAAEMEQTAQAFRPDGALQVLAAIDHLPEALAHVANVFAILAARCDQAFPVDARVGEALAAVHATLTTAIDAAGEVGTVFRTVHALDIARLENPRSGEAMWDTTAGPAQYGAPPAAVGLRPGEVSDAIRQAYHALANQHRGNPWVALAPLRAALPAHYNREQVDQALRALAGVPGVHVIPVANLKSLTQADRDAALWLGGENNHVLMIE
jgi:hypothetical protein